MVDDWTPQDWEELLSEELAVDVVVTYGRSRTVPVHARHVRLEGRPAYQVRLHGMFAQAPEEVREDVARWMRVGRRARKVCERLDRWIASELAALPKRRPGRANPKGEAHDLSALAEGLFAGFFASDFEERPRPILTWGQRRKSSSRRSLRLGSYDPETNVVRLHPVLDQPGVPEWFVRFVLMHEILHAVLPPRPGSGSRMIHHGPEFRRREQSYPDHSRALRWEEKNLARLIRSARTGSRLRVRTALFG